jgi:hypothetical protein
MVAASYKLHVHALYALLLLSAMLENVVHTLASSKFYASNFHLLFHLEHVST